MATPPLGFIEPKDRTQEQADAHQSAVSRMMAGTGLAPRKLAKGEKVILTDFLKRPEVIADMGMEFTGFRQLTGSCVGVATGNKVAVTSAIQRVISDNPTKAFIPWWPFTYGRTRYNEGDRGQGEGAVSSVAGDTLDKEGCFAKTEVPGLPEWDTRDGLAIPSKLEYQWSDGGSNLVSQHVPLGKTHTSVAKAIINTTDEAETSIINGYPVANGCAYYVGGGSLKGSGANALAVGRYNSRGGHETLLAGAWNNPDYGLHFLYWNQWDGNTYPKDGTGLPRCAVWVPEAEVNRMLNAGWNGINPGEAWSVSHIDYFPAQADKIIQWSQMWGSP